MKSPTREKRRQRTSRSSELGEDKVDALGTRDHRGCGFCRDTEPNGEFFTGLPEIMDTHGLPCTANVPPPLTVDRTEVTCLMAPPPQYAPGAAAANTSKAMMAIGISFLTTDERGL
jgi:hypothetical protein